MGGRTRDHRPGRLAVHHGSVYAMRIGERVDAATGAIDYYRPEDLEVDQAALTLGQAKVGGTDTGIEEFGNYGEVLCITDGTLTEATAKTATPAAQYLVVGDPQYDLSAELTGGIFDANGSTMYISVQHNVTGSGVVLAITGWR